MEQHDALSSPLPPTSAAARPVTMVDQASD